MEAHLMWVKLSAFPQAQPGSPVLIIAVYPPLPSQA
jgi:hypothetical protein